MQHAICYISNVDSKMTMEAINQLLKFCEKNNNQRNIKGILLFSEGNFFQVLEGEKQVVTELWEKIKNDPRHYGYIQVFGKDLAQGSYDSYKAEMLSEEKKSSSHLPKEYKETLEGMAPQVQRVIERMMENFIATRI